MTLTLPAEPEPEPAEPDTGERSPAEGSDPRQPKMPARPGTFQAMGAGRTVAGPAR